MTFKEYDEACREFDKNETVIFRLVKLMEEVGEVAQVYTKNDPSENMLLELGDVLYQISRLAAYYDWDLEKVAEHNVKKLKYREEFGR